MMFYAASWHQKEYNNTKNQNQGHMTELLAFGLRKLSFNGDGVLLLYIVLIGHAIISQLNATTIPDGFKYNERNTLMVV